MWIEKISAEFERDFAPELALLRAEPHDSQAGQGAPVRRQIAEAVRSQLWAELSARMEVWLAQLSPLMFGGLAEAAEPTPPEELALHAAVRGGRHLWDAAMDTEGAWPALAGLLDTLGPEGGRS